MPIPSSDDVAQIKAEKVMQGIGEIIENEDLKEMIEIIEKQVNDSDYTAMDIAPAFLKQALGQVNLKTTERMARSTGITPEQRKVWFVSSLTSVKKTA